MSRIPERRVYPTLRIFVGPMFSGKTSTALRIAERSAIVHQGFAVHIVHSIDKDRIRDSGMTGAYTHSSIARGKTDLIRTRVVDSLTHVDVLGATSVSVDEANLFPAKELVDFVRRLMEPGPNLRDIVICGLDGDMCQRPFDSGIPILLPLSTEFRKLSAVCTHCIAEFGEERDAPFTIRIVPLPNPPSSGGTLVGGRKEYSSVCRRHLSLSAVTESELSEWFKS